MAHTYPTRHRCQLLAAGAVLSAILLPTMSWAQAVTQPTAQPTAQLAFFEITVNSPLDGSATPDEVLTLREAIALTNGTLPISELSTAEQSLVVSQPTHSTIRFELPAEQTAIELVSVLPAIAQSGLTIDGTTQPGYDADKSATAEIAIPVPVVTIRPADGQEVFRGLTVSADNVTIRGLNLYGFNSPGRITNSTPPADIFITHLPAPLNRETPLPESGMNSQEQPPKGVVIEQNWLGLTLEETLPDVPSGFGVSVFDSVGTTIRQNRIEYHNGSAVITGRQADNLQVLENIIVGNGLAGMPDAIRLDGQVNEGLISSNLICGNDGSGVFLFKPDGAVTVVDNDIRHNGQRLRRAAVYVMGDDHQVVDNVISDQKGGGVVVTAFGQGPNTQSQSNVITGNRFSNIEGLSIDLNARRDRAAQDFQRGDGPNPLRNSHNRRQDTANSAVNAPQFLSPEFFVIDGKVVIKGRADANNEIQLYRSVGSEKGSEDNYGPLSEPVQVAAADEAGLFEFVLEGLVGGEVFSAIATDPRYGTSEPAVNTVVRSLDGSASTIASSVSMPQCTTAPPPPEPPSAPPQPSEPPAPLEPSIPEEIRLEIPRNIHYGLDKDFINPDSAIILDRIADVMQQYPSIIVDLHGHTDSRASVAYNQDLARRRAENARRYLMRKGIGPERMTIRSFGETQLRAEETDRMNYARNRRVEFVFSDVRGADITFVDQESDLQIEP
ncbi:MAG: OmpA family protein [Phormidesmis sp.]